MIAQADGAGLTGANPLTEFDNALAPSVTAYDVAMLRRHAEQFAFIGEAVVARHLRDLASRLAPLVPCG